MLRRCDLGDGEVVDGVLEGDGAADGVVDGGQIERGRIDVVLRQVLAQVLPLDLEAMACLVLRRPLDHVLEGQRDIEVVDAHGQSIGDDRDRPNHRSSVTRRRRRWPTWGASRSAARRRGATGPCHRRRGERAGTRAVPRCGRCPTRRSWRTPRGGRPCGPCRRCRRSGRTRRRPRSGRAASGTTPCRRCAAGPRCRPARRCVRAGRSSDPAPAVLTRCTDQPGSSAREILHGVLCADEGDADLHQHLTLLRRVERHEGATGGAGARRRCPETCRRRSTSPPTRTAGRRAPRNAACSWCRSRRTARSTPGPRPRRGPPPARSPQ